MPPAIARVLSGDDARGTAFAVSQSYALTAFHCIGDRQTGQITLANQTLQFPSAGRVDSEYVPDSGSHLDDFAVLRLKHPLRSSFEPFQLVSRAYPLASFQSKGFPSKVVGPDWVTVSGFVEEPDGSLYGSPAIQLSCTQSGAGLTLGGLSGAPVLLCQSQAAVGIVRWNPVDAEQPSQPLPGGIVFACPISSVIARCRFLLQDTKLISDATEAEKIIDVQELRRSAKDNTLKIQADKILERFNRRIILHDLAGPFRPDWIQIPSFNYTLPKSAAISTRDLIKNFFRALALGIRDLFPKDAPEFQFVFLCRLDEREEETRLSFIIPFQNLLGYIHDILDDPKGMKAELEGKKALDILHKYGILPGAYFPVVAVYRPILRYVEFNNQNQINSPQQFLSPHLCHTTSGFLNFLGVLEARHLEVQGSPGPPIFQFDNLHEAMNKGLDNWFRWLYCFLDTKVLFDPNRLYISSNDPERYDYFYSGEKQGL